MLNYVDHYNAAESRIRHLLATAGRAFSSNEVKGVEEFLNAGEYGLALETFAAILLTNEAQFFEPAVVETIQSLATEMHVFDSKSVNSIVALYERQNFGVAL
jgi:thymidine kinase